MQAVNAVVRILCLTIATLAVFVFGGLAVLTWIGSRPETVLQQQAAYLSTLMYCAFAILVLMVVRLAMQERHMSQIRVIAERLDTLAIVLQRMALAPHGIQATRPDDHRSPVAKELDAACDSCGGPGPTTPYTVNHREAQVCAPCFEKLEERKVQGMLRAKK